MKRTKEQPIKVGDTVTILMGGGKITGVIREIRPDQKAVITRDGKPDVVRSLAFVEPA